MPVHFWGSRRKGGLQNSRPCEKSLNSPMLESVFKSEMRVTFSQAFVLHVALASPHVASTRGSTCERKLGAETSNATPSRRGGRHLCVVYVCVMHMFVSWPKRFASQKIMHVCCACVFELGASTCTPWVESSLHNSAIPRERCPLGARPVHY